MAAIRAVTADFAVSPQIAVADLAEAARLGFGLVINNRPDGEEAGQPAGDALEAAARAAGLDYLALPIVGRPTAAQARAQAEAAAGRKTIAFCRSGTRSIAAWAMGAVASGSDRAEILELARRAGYDLAGIT